MKVTSTQVEQTFQPVDVTITLETQKELDAFGSLFNCPFVLNAIQEITGGLVMWEEVYEVLDDTGADIHLSHRFYDAAKSA